MKPFNRTKMISKHDFFHFRIGFTTFITVLLSSLLLWQYFQGGIPSHHFLADKSKFAAAGALGVNPYFVDGYAKAALNYNTAKLKHVFAYLKECDLKAKGVDNPSIENGELLKEMIFKILH